jgi:photosystem II stability/assembly factor-like uncharacterized protein
VTALARGRDAFLLAGGTTAAGDLVLYRKPGPGAAWARLDPVQAGYWGGAGEPYRKWAAGHIAVRNARQAVLLLSQDSEEGSVLLESSDGGLTWRKMSTPPGDLYSVHFISSKQGWLTGSRGSLWLTEDGGSRWQSQPNPGNAPAGVLAFDPAGSGFGVAPLWHGRVLLTRTGQTWRVVDVGLGYSMPGAVVVDRGRAYVLGAGGQIARYIDPGVPHP